MKVESTIEDNHHQLILIDLYIQYHYVLFLLYDRKNMMYNDEYRDLQLMIKDFYLFVNQD